MVGISEVEVEGGLPRDEIRMGPRLLHQEQGMNTCPECRGSGRYVGLTVDEPCRACGGTGERKAPTTKAEFLARLTPEQRGILERMMKGTHRMPGYRVMPGPRPPVHDNSDVVQRDAK